MSRVRVSGRDLALANIWSRLCEDQQQTFLSFARWFECYHRDTPERRAPPNRSQQARSEAALPVVCLLHRHVTHDWADVTAACKPPREDFRQALADLRQQVRHIAPTVAVSRAVEKCLTHLTATAERYKKCYAVAAYRVGRYGVRAVLAGAYRKDRASVERALDVLWPYLTAYPELAARVLVRAGWFDVPEEVRRMRHPSTRSLIH